MQMIVDMFNIMIMMVHVDDQMIVDVYNMMILMVHVDDQMIADVYNMMKHDDNDGTCR